MVHDMMSESVAGIKARFAIVDPDFLRICSFLLRLPSPRSANPGIS